MRVESPMLPSASSATAFERLGRALRALLPALCILSLVLLFFWRFLTPKTEDRVAFPAGDFTDQYYAWRLYEARELAGGHLPLWSPYFQSGHPFLADPQSQVFYPVAFAVTWLASRGGDLPVAALQAEAFLHFLLAGVFTFYFVRKVLRRAGGADPPLRVSLSDARGSGASGDRKASFGAMVAAVSFTFGGYLTSYPPLQLTILETVTWLPLVLLCLDIAAERGTVASFLIAGIALAVAFLAGHPQTFLMTGYVSLAYYVFRVWELSSRIRSAGVTSTRDPRRARLDFVTRRLAMLLVSAAAAVGLSAVQLLPSVEYAAVSTRATTGFLTSSAGMPPLDLVQMILPGFVTAFASPVYVGILALWLAVAATVARRHRPVVFWGVLAVAALLLSLGGYSFLYGLFYLVAPGFALFSDQGRAVGAFSFAASVLAGYGAYLLAGPLPRAYKATVLGAYRLLCWAPLAGLAVTLLCFYGLRSLPDSGSFAFLVDRASLMTLTFILCAWLVGLRLFGGAGRRTVLALSILLIVFDLFTVDGYSNQARPVDRFPPTPQVQAMQSDGAWFRVTSDSLPRHFGVVYRLADIGGASPLRAQTYQDLVGGLPESRLWRLLGVRYLVTNDRRAPAGASEVLKEGDTSLYRLPDPLPRAWIATRAVADEDKNRTLSQLASPAFDIQRTVILAGTPAGLPLPEGVPAGQEAVTVTQRTSEDLVVDLNAPAGGILVLNEVYYPGWRAVLDGSEVPIYRADWALRAVLPPAGSHRLEMIYDPLPFRAGAAVSLCTLVITGAYLAWAWRKR
jgi:hypothetical protein